MSRTLTYLLLPLGVLLAVTVYLVGSLAVASEDEPPSRAPVVLPSESGSPSSPGSPGPTSSPSEESSGVPVVTPDPIDDDDDDDDDHDDRHDDD